MLPFAERRVDSRGTARGADHRRHQIRPREAPQLLRHVLHRRGQDEQDGSLRQDHGLRPGGAGRHGLLLLHPEHADDRARGHGLQRGRRRGGPEARPPACRLEAREPVQARRVGHEARDGLRRRQRACSAAPGTQAERHGADGPHGDPQRAAAAHFPAEGAGQVGRGRLERLGVSGGGEGRGRRSRASPAPGARRVKRRPPGVRR
mmetsp:Transcript_99625/g.321195  ORF Transcript_99625/g.321195 Transcript_99625/m.321195 type:complete len:205 (-) Transcript_99625:49-663(-)